MIQTTFGPILSPSTSNKDSALITGHASNLPPSKTRVQIHSFLAQRLIEIIPFWPSLAERFAFFLTPGFQTQRTLSEPRVSLLPAYTTGLCKPTTRNFGVTVRCGRFLR